MSISQLLTPGIEILIIAMMIYSLLSFFWKTRAMDLLFGLAAVGLFYGVSAAVDLPVLRKLMLYVVNVGVIALLIIFQPEMRIALSKLSVKGKKYRELNEFDHFLDEMTQVIYRLSGRRTGALITIENQDSLDEFINKAHLLHAQFSPELLESIFSTTTPLHDGGVIIRGTTILCAGAIFPLADDSSQIAKSMGTRHRAALGISQLTDSLTVVVSEETGKVSIARDGIMTRSIKPDRFRGIIRSVFTPPSIVREKGESPISKLLNRVRQWINT